MKQKRLHMIGNAHIDPVWLWRWQEGYHEVLATFRSVLDRMQEDDAFTFACSSAAFYEWVEQSDPLMFAEIQQRVDEGRWEIVGGWWVQPDCNLPAGESFARHALYGQRYFLERFNKDSADVNVRDIGLTVLRSPIYAHHLPVEPESGDSYDFIDQGRQTFTYSLLPHAGSWEEAGTVRRAAELNQRPQALLATCHPQGTLPTTASYLRVDQDNVDVTVLKQAEDSDDLILRCHETARVATTATIELPLWQRTITAEFRPCEVKTWRIPLDPALPVRETSFLKGVPAAAGTEKRQPGLRDAKPAGHSGQQPSRERLLHWQPAKVTGNGQRPDHRQRLIQRHPKPAGCLDAVVQATVLLAACFRAGGKLLLCALLEEEFFVASVSGTSNREAGNGGYVGEEVERNGQNIPS